MKDFRDEFTDMKSNFLSQLQSKAETQEIDRLAAILLHKPDINSIEDMQNLFKSDISNSLDALKNDVRFECHKLEDLVYEKL